MLNGKTLLVQHPWPSSKNVYRSPLQFLLVFGLWIFETLQLPRRKRPSYIVKLFIFHLWPSKTMIFLYNYWSGHPWSRIRTALETNFRIMVLLARVFQLEKVSKKNLEMPIRKNEKGANFFTRISPILLPFFSLNRRVLENCLTFFIIWRKH